MASMASVAHIKRLHKLSSLAHSMFMENLTGRNVLREMLIPEMNSALMIVACRFVDVVKLFAYYSNTVWSKTTRYNACEIMNELLAKYDKQLGQWREEKLKTRHKYTFPKCKISSQDLFRKIIDEEMQLMRYVQAFNGLSKSSSDHFKAQQSAQIIQQAAELVACMISVWDQEYAATVRLRLCMAITNCSRSVVVSPATDGQKYMIWERLRESKRFTDSAMLAIFTENFYVISYSDSGEDEACGFVITNKAVHKEAGKEKDIIITHIETEKSHRRLMMATRLLAAIRDIAAENGYHSMYATSMYPNTLFWKKCGFEPRLNGKRNQLAFCCLNKMSFCNILN